MTPPQKALPKKDGPLEPANKDKEELRGLSILPVPTTALDPVPEVLC